MRRDIARNHTPGPYGAAVADSYTGENCHAATYPAVIAYGDRQCPLTTTVALGHVRAVASRVYAHIRAYEGVIAYGDIGFVKHRKAEIGEEAAAYAYMSAIIASERLIDVYILT